MNVVFLIIWYVVLFVFLIALFYVLATYLLLAYDRSLSRHHLVSPAYLDRMLFPSRGKAALGITGEIASIFVVILAYPLAYLMPSWKSGKGDGRPILLLHGYKHNQSGWFLMKRRLRRAGFGPIYSMNLPPNRGGIPAHAERVAAFVAKIEQRTGQHKLILIGHSMGGLVASYYAEVLAPPQKVSHLITLGSPLKGTRLSALNFGRTARQMRPGSAFLRDLEWRISSDGFTHYYNIATRFDNMIFPYQSALLDLPEQSQYILEWQGHMTLIFSKQVAKKIIHWLAASAKNPLPIRQKLKPSTS